MAICIYYEQKRGIVKNNETHSLIPNMLVHERSKWNNLCSALQQPTQHLNEI